MSLKPAIGVVLCACAGALAGWSVRGSTELDAAGGGVARSSAVWNYRATSLAQMVTDVDAVVLARWQSVSPGRTILSSRGEAPTPFEENRFTVVAGYKGLRAGETFVVERLATRQPDNAVFDADGGSYAAAERYLLFLRRQSETGFYFVVNDEARYTIDGRGRLMPTLPGHHGKVATQMRTQTLDAVARTIGERVKQGGGVK
jgi:hypothetical protein